MGRKEGTYRQGVVPNDVCDESVTVCCGKLMVALHPSLFCSCLQ